MNTVFSNQRTIEQFKAEQKTAKLYFNYMSKKNAQGVAEPMYYKDEHGNPTNIQQVAIQNEAGVTVATASKEIAQELKEGKNIFERPVAVVDTTYADASTSEVRTVAKLVHPASNNRIELC